MASTAKEEVVRLYHNVRTAATLRINLKELSFTQPLTPTRTDNYAAEGIIATSAKKISKAMDMIFYWTEDRLKQKYLFVYWKPGSQNMGN